MKTCENVLYGVSKEVWSEFKPQQSTETVLVNMMPTYVDVSAYLALGFGKFVHVHAKYFTG